MGRPQVEKLLIARVPGKDQKLAETQELRIAEFDLGDIYVDTFSTKSPPSYVHNEYLITRKDYVGLWGVLADSNITEIDIK